MNDSSHSLFMKEAINLSIVKMQAGHGGPFGAIIVKNGTIIARGYNRVTSTHDPTAHAEIDAIRKACAAIGDHVLQGCVLYTSCEPCPMCLAAIYWARIAIIYYGNTREDAAKIGFDDQLIYDEVEKPIQDRMIRMTRINAEDALKAFKLWQDKEDKMVY